MSSVTSETTVPSQGAVITNETITSNVAPLIANVPQAKGSPTTFIKPSSVEQIEISRRSASAADVAPITQRFNTNTPVSNFLNRSNNPNVRTQRPPALPS